MKAIVHETIQGAGPCKAYSGQAVAIGGPDWQIIVLAADHATLRNVAKVFNPSAVLDSSAVYAVTLVPDASVIRKDSSL